MFCCREFLTFLIVLALMVGGFDSVRLVYGQQPDMPKGSFPKTFFNEAGTRWPLEGQVVSPLGLPVPNAVINVDNHRPIHPFYMNWGYDDPRFNTVGDIQGKFTASVSQSSVVVIDAAGYAPAFFSYPDESWKKIQLEIGRELTGIIYGIDGTPAADVKVTPVNWIVPIPKPYRLKHWTHRHAMLPDCGKSRAVKTDHEGRFRMPHMPKHSRTGLLIEPTSGKPEVVYVRAENDHREIDKEGQILVDNDFEFDVANCFSLKLNAFDENGKRAKIRRVYLSPNHIDAHQNFKYLREVDVDHDEVLIPLLHHKDGSHVFVQPAQSDVLLGKYFEIPAGKDDEMLEREVRFEKGMTISGRVVDEWSQQPIVNVPIAWVPMHAPQMHHVNGNFPAREIVTQKDGKFKIAVPEESCAIGVAGIVDGYLGVTFGVQSFEKFKTFDYPCISNTLRILKQQEMVDNLELEFRLRPAIDAKVQVIDASRKAVPNAIVVVHKVAGYELEQQFSNTYVFQQRPDVETLTASEDGIARLKGVYFEAFATALARRQQEKDNQTGSTSDFVEGGGIGSWNGFPAAAVVSASSPDGFLHGQARVLVPRDVQQTEVDVTVVLRDGVEAYGQIVDLSGNGINDVAVIATSTLNNGNQWWTRTRKDGWFKLSGLQPGGDYQWRLGARVSLGWQAGEALDAKTIAADKPTWMGTLVVEDFTNLLAPFPPLELERLTNAKAMERLKEYVVQLKQRIPSNLGESRRKLWDSAEYGLRSRMAETLKPHIVGLANRQPGSAYEISILNFICDHVLPKRGTSDSDAERDLRDFCRKRFLNNHIQDEATQQRIVDLTIRCAYSYKRKEALEDLMERPILPETKAICALHLLCDSDRIVQYSLKQSVSDEVFSKRLTEFKRVLRKANRHLQDLDVAKHKDDLELLLKWWRKMKQNYDSEQWHERTSEWASPARARAIFQALNDRQSMVERFME